jgi:hypothetical protein
VYLLRGGHRISQISGLLLGVSLFSYRAREFLVCWLIFSLLFIGLALLILAGGLAYYAGKCALNWATISARVTPVVGLGPSELCPKTISDHISLK